MGATRPRSLPIRLRLALWYALFLLACIVGIGLFLLASLERSLEQETDQALRLRAFRVAREIVTRAGERLAPGDVRSELLELAPSEEFAAPGIYVHVLDREGAVIASSPNLGGGQLPVTPALITGALAGREAYETVQAEAERVRLLAQPVASAEHVIGVVLVGESLHLLDVTLRSTRQLLLLAASGAALVCLLGGWWLTGRALGPIAEVTRVARRIGATGQFGQRIAEPATRDELHELAATFNEMLAGIEQSFAHQQEFLANASHELRGPLAVIRGNLDLLTLDLPDQERREAAREAAEEAVRISELVSDLLFLAEVDTRELLEHQPVALDEVVDEAWERAKRLDDGAHVLALACNQPAIVRGDRNRLSQLVWNLLENALRYTPRGGRVELALRARGQVVELTVADTGIGIPPEHLPRIFERFYRVDRVRSRGQGGTGLGLAIVKQVAETHRGQVQVRSEPGQGTVFTVILPTQQP